MSSKAIVQKRRAVGDYPPRGSPHSSTATGRKTPTSLKQEKKPSVVDNPDKLVLSGSPHFLKVNLGKENNNLLSAKKESKNREISQTNTTPSSLRTATRGGELPVKSSAGSTVVVKAKTPKASGGPTLCASAVLSSSTSALAKRYRKNTTKSGNDHDISTKTDSPERAKTSAGRDCAKRVAKEKRTPGNFSPYHATPPKRRPLLENSTTACASPTFRSLPNDMVRNIVKTIESKPPVSSSAGSNHKSPRDGDRFTVRKNLAKQLYHSATKRSRSSFVSNLSQNIDKEVIPEDFSVTVAVRVRPFSQKEKDGEAKQVVFMRENETTITDGNSEHTFAYDFSFDSIESTTGTTLATQAVVYEKLARPLLSAAFNGYNTCLFAYGQTGSGKSYTIMGNNQDIGVIPRFCEEVFGGVNAVSSNDKSVQFHIEMSYFEIYNEKIHDLLVSAEVAADGEKNKRSLRVREHPETGPYVEGLSAFVVRNFEDIQSWLDVGNQQRVTASTGMNDKSSRSHSVFILNMARTTVEELEGERHESSRRSHINLVDLAGSERSSTAQTTGQRLKRVEGSHINKSLLTLGKVIFMLSERSKVSCRRQSRVFIPYRDSALTWLLKESLGGNSRTAMLATISPAKSHMEETLSTLRYAAQARTIINSVKINEDPNAAIIRELKSEIAKLRTAHQSQSVNVEEYRATIREVAQLREKLSSAENDKEEANTRWQEKLEESEKRKAEEISELKRAGVSFKVDNSLPNLVNLNEDPQLSELLLYVIKHGTTRVGKKGGPHECEIQLGGALIADIHCEIVNKNEVVTVTPSDPNAKIFINGEIIQKMTTLHHADRIIIAGNHFFRLNHPIEVQRKRINAGLSNEEKKDFEFAKNELITAQNARMEAEIERARIKAKQEMLKEIELAKHEAQSEITEQKEQYEQVVKSLRNKLGEDESTKMQLEVIREENLVLQKEVDANRRRQEMEARIAAEKTVMVENDTVTLNIFAELEAERLKLARDIERMEQNLKKKKAEGSKKVQKSDCGNGTPLRVSILLEEANRISAELERNTVFSRHDPDDEKVQIKVENTKLEIWTLWSMEKFEGKLEGMREAYDSRRNKCSLQNESNGNSDTEDDLFYDPADTWVEVFNTSAVMQSREILGASAEASTVARPNKSRRITRRLSSLTLAKTSPALRQSLLQYEQRHRSSSVRKFDDPSIMSLCKNAVTSMVDNLEDVGDSAMDMFLQSLHHLSCACEDLATSFYIQQDSSIADSSDVQDGEPSFKATMELKSCISCIRCMRSAVNQSQKQKFSSKLIQKLTESTKKLAGELAKLLQGYEVEIEPIVRESCGRIRVLIPNISKYAGALCLASETPLNILEEGRERTLTHRIKNAFIQGADSFLRKVLNDGMTDIRNSHCMSLESDNSGQLKLFKSALDVLRSCKDLQQMLCESSLKIRETDLPPQYYQQYIQRSRGMSDVISILVEKLEGYDAACKKGEVFGDFGGMEETLRECAERIARLSLPQRTLLAEMNNTSNCNNSNNGTSFEDDTERMYYAVQDAAEELIDASTSLFGAKQQNSADVNKEMRLLDTPQHQATTFNMSHRIGDVSGSTAISNSVKKMLELTDHVG